MKILTMPEQNTPEWHSFRQNYIGASDAITIMEVSPWTKPEELLLEKLGTSPPKQENSHMRRGKALETPALRKFEQVVDVDIGYMMSPKVVLHPTINYMMASMDGIDIDGKACVEIKCPGPRDHYIALQGDIPGKYYPQLQHQIEVLGVDMVYYFSYRIDKKDPFTKETIISWANIPVYRNQMYIDEMLEKERMFWDLVCEMKG